MDAVAKKALSETPLVEAHRAAGASIDEWFGCALPSSFGDWRSEYQAARKTVALLDKNYRTYLGFTGPDRVRYLNAILTNNIKDLKPGEGIASLFLNPQGRIQAEIETYAEAEKLFCVSFAMIREKLISALNHYIIMDDVALRDESTKFYTLGLEGPWTAEIVRKASGIDLKSLKELSWADGNVGGMPCRIVRRSFAGNPNAEFLCEQGHLLELWSFLREAVTTYGGAPVGYTSLNALRLEAGVPWFGYDFGEKQIPHEAGLEHSHISYTKGCYTGQEIVERVRSRGQVNRVRALFQLSVPELPAAETPIMFDGKEVGHVTRAAYSPAFQSNIAMGYVRREQSVIGSTVRVGEGTASVVAPHS
jgi:folate-binding protein YgfZ